MMWRASLGKHETLVGQLYNLIKTCMYHDRCDEKLVVKLLSYMRQQAMETRGVREMDQELEMGQRWEEKQQQVATGEVGAAAAEAAAAAAAAVVGSPVQGGRARDDSEGEQGSERKRRKLHASPRLQQGSQRSSAVQAMSTEANTLLTGMMQLCCEKQTLTKPYLEALWEWPRGGPGDARGVPSKDGVVGPTGGGGGDSSGVGRSDAVGDSSFVVNLLFSVLKQPSGRRYLAKYMRLCVQSLCVQNPELAARDAGDGAGAGAGADGGLEGTGSLCGEEEGRYGEEEGRAMLFSIRMLTTLICDPDTAADAIALVANQPNRGVESSGGKQVGGGGVDAKAQPKDGDRGGGMSDVDMDDQEAVAEYKANHSAKQSAKQSAKCSAPGGSEPEEAVPSSPPSPPPAAAAAAAAAAGGLKVSAEAAGDLSVEDPMEEGMEADEKADAKDAATDTESAEPEPPMPLLQLLLSAIGAAAAAPGTVAAPAAMSARMRTRVVDACMDLLRYLLLESPMQLDIEQLQYLWRDLGSQRPTLVLSWFYDVLGGTGFEERCGPPESKQEEEDSEEEEEYEEKLGRKASGRKGSGRIKAAKAGRQAKSTGYRRQEIPFSADTLDHVFVQLVCSIDFGGGGSNGKGYDCFLRYFIICNMRHGLCTAEGSGSLDGKRHTYHTLRLHGMEKLWEIALGASGDVGRRASELLVDIHTNCDECSAPAEGSGGERVHAAAGLTASIFSRLQQFVDGSGDVSSGDRSGGDRSSGDRSSGDMSSSGMPSSEVALLRLLTLLNLLLKKATLTHGGCRSHSTDSYSRNIDFAIVLSEERDAKVAARITVSSHDTLASLILAVASKLTYASAPLSERPDIVRLHGGRGCGTLLGGSHSLALQQQLCVGDLGINFGEYDALRVSIDTVPRAEPSQHLHPHPGDIISSSEAYIDLLFVLLKRWNSRGGRRASGSTIANATGMASGSGGCAATAATADTQVGGSASESVAEKAWGILATVPTSLAILTRCCTPSAMSVTHWRSLLCDDDQGGANPTGQPYRALYALEIVSGLLHPAIDSDRRYAALIQRVEAEKAARAAGAKAGAEAGAEGSSGGGGSSAGSAMDESSGGSKAGMVHIGGGVWKASGGPAKSASSPKSTTSPTHNGLPAGQSAADGDGGGGDSGGGAGGILAAPSSSEGWFEAWRRDFVGSGGLKTVLSIVTSIGAAASAADDDGADGTSAAPAATTAAGVREDVLLDSNLRVSLRIIRCCLHSEGSEKVVRGQVDFNLLLNSLLAVAAMDAGGGAEVSGVAATSNVQQAAELVTMIYSMAHPARDSEESDAHDQGMRSSGGGGSSSGGGSNGSSCGNVGGGAGGDGGGSNSKVWSGAKLDQRMLVKLVARLVPGHGYPPDMSVGSSALDHGRRRQQKTILSLLCRLCTHAQRADSGAAGSGAADSGAAGSGAGGPETGQSIAHLLFNTCLTTVSPSNVCLAHRPQRHYFSLFNFLLRILYAPSAEYDAAGADLAPLRTLGLGMLSRLQSMATERKLPPVPVHTGSGGHAQSTDGDGNQLSAGDGGDGGSAAMAEGPARVHLSGFLSVITQLLQLQRKMQTSTRPDFEIFTADDRRLLVDLTFAECLMNQQAPLCPCPCPYPNNLRAVDADADEAVGRSAEANSADEEAVAVSNAYSLLLELCHRVEVLPRLTERVVGSIAGVGRAIELEQQQQGLDFSVGSFAGWDFNAVDEQKSAVGYVGLLNQGFTCYINSLMQQFFMVPEFRCGILRTRPPPTDVIAKVQYGSQLNAMLRHLQRLFSFLLLSDAKAYNPRAFISQLKNEPAGFFPLESPVTEQNDALEFLNLFMARMETALEHTNAPTLLKKCFEGKTVNQIIPVGGSCPHYSEREEPFYHISLEVKNKLNIQQSLDMFVRSDLLEGDNAYLCEKCGKKVSAAKRTCLASLPDTLIIHLKRFELDYDTLDKLKVNDSCSFPLLLELAPYTKEHLATAAAVDGAGVDGAEGGGTSGGTNDGHTGGAGGNRRSSEASGSKQCTLFRLKGILVHSGTANSGHYYSIIQERQRGQGSECKQEAGGVPPVQGTTQLSDGGGSIASGGTSQAASTASAGPGAGRAAGAAGSRPWNEFNDDEVEHFLAEEIGLTCFGGTRMQRVKNYKTGLYEQKEFVQQKNAFMLFYDKLDKEVAPGAAGAAAGAAGAAAGAGGAEAGVGEVGMRAAEQAPADDVDCTAGEVSLPVACDSRPAKRAKHVEPEGSSKGEGGDHATAADGGSSVLVPLHLRSAVAAANRALWHRRRIFNAPNFNFVIDMLTAVFAGGGGASASAGKTSSMKTAILPKLPVEPLVRQLSLVAGGGGGELQRLQMLQTATFFMVDIFWRSQLAHDWDHLHKDTQSQQKRRRQQLGGGAGMAIVPLLKAMYSSSVEGCSWLIWMLSTRHKEWSRRLLLDCPHRRFSQAFSELVVHALVVLESRAPQLMLATVAPSVTRTEETYGEGGGAANGSAHGGSSGRDGAVIDCAIEEDDDEVPKGAAGMLLKSDGAQLGGDAAASAGGGGSGSTGSTGIGEGGGSTQDKDGGGKEEEEEGGSSGVSVQPLIEQFGGTVFELLRTATLNASNYMPFFDFIAQLCAVERSADEEAGGSDGGDDMNDIDCGSLTRSMLLQQHLLQQLANAYIENKEDDDLSCLVTDLTSDVHKLSSHEPSAAFVLLKCVAAVLRTVDVAEENGDTSAGMSGEEEAKAADSDGDDGSADGGGDQNPSRRRRRRRQFNSGRVSGRGSGGGDSDGFRPTLCTSVDWPTRAPPHDLETVISELFLLKAFTDGVNKEQQLTEVRQIVTHLCWENMGISRRLGKTLHDFLMSQKQALIVDFFKVVDVIVDVRDVYQGERVAMLLEANNDFQMGVMRVINRKSCWESFCNINTSPKQIDLAHDRAFKVLQDLLHLMDG
jgi:ubiquitin C-terminal hydrolase